MKKLLIFIYTILIDLNRYYQFIKKTISINTLNNSICSFLGFKAQTKTWLPKETLDKNSHQITRSDFIKDNEKFSFWWQNDTTSNECVLDDFMKYYHQTKAYKFRAKKSLLEIKTHLDK